MDLYMLTTTDNPYSPVTNYDDWLAWDLPRYNSNALLARVVHLSMELSEADQAVAIHDAIDEILEYNVSGVHTKVKLGTLDVPSDHEQSLNNEANQAA